MIKTILVLLYVWSGQLKLDQVPFASHEECLKEAPAIMDKQMKDPRFEQGLFAACLNMKASEAKNHK
jgi:hypothetical protein